MDSTPLPAPRPPRVVVVRVPNWLGDVVMCTPALTLLAGALGAEDELVLAGRGAKLEMLRRCWPRAGPRVRFWDVADKAAAPRRPDVAVLLTNSFSSALWAWRLGARVRIGFDRGGRRLLLTRALPYRAAEWQSVAEEPVGRRAWRVVARSQEPGWPRQMTEYYGELARATVEVLTGSASGAPLRHPQLVADEAGRRVRELLAAAGVDDGQRLFGYQPGAAAGTAKRYPAAQLAEAMRLVGAAHPEARWVALAGPGEEAIGREVAALAGVDFLCPGLDLDVPGLVALIDRLDLVICNDSGPMHMAVALGRRCVAIFGPMDWRSTGHEGSPQHRLVRADGIACAPCMLPECPIDHRCMTRIEPNRVADAALELLAQ